MQTVGGFPSLPDRNVAVIMVAHGCLIIESSAIFRVILPYECDKVLSVFDPHAFPLIIGNDCPEHF